MRLVQKSVEPVQLLEVVENEGLPEVLRVASELYAQDRVQMERAALQMELKKAAAEAGLPFEYVERAAMALKERRVAGSLRRQVRRGFLTAMALMLTLAVVWGVRTTVRPPSFGPPPEAYLSYPGGYGSGAPYGYGSPYSTPAPGPYGLGAPPAVRQPGGGYPGSPPPQSGGGFGAPSPAALPPGYGGPRGP
jgi:hypothetical protein